MNNGVKFVLERLRERSTWVGIAGFIMAVGISMSPEHVEAFVTAGTAIVSAILIFTKD